jgi:hypothetical protein
MNNYFHETIHTLYRNGNGGQATLKGKPFIPTMPLPMAPK